MTLTSVCHAQIEVVNGDTIRVDGEAVKIRGIDAPELDQPYGLNAKLVLENIVSLFDPELKRLTRPGPKGRFSDLLINKDGEVLSVGETLISLGLAWSTDSKRMIPSKNQKLMAKAKRSKKNLWSESNPINPAAWRKNPARYKINLGSVVQARYNEKQRRLAQQVKHLAELKSQYASQASESRESNQKLLASIEENAKYSKLYNKMNKMNLYDQVLQVSEGSLLTGLSDIDDVRQMLK